MSNFPDFSDHNYQVIRELGCNREGGRISYLARKLNSDQQIVIKQFRFVQDSASWKGFKAYERELQILRELNHPRIPKYIDSFETPDGFCLVQEYKNAPSLGSRGSLTPEAIKQIAVSVLEILVDLQSRTPTIIHRDLKPENILVDQQNNAYLIDFGLSRMRDGEVAISSIALGTPGFMPPEELFNRRLTEASDLYSLGATLIGLLTRTPSVEISHLIDENYRFKFKHLVKGLNPRFISWLTKMVEPNVKNRYANAAIALEELKPIEITGSSASKLSEIIQSQWFKPLTVSGIILAFVGGTVGMISFLLGRSTFNNPIVSLSSTPTERTLTPEQKWFNRIKPRCNSVEVVVAMRLSPHPQTHAGVAYAAGCYALAGKIDQADQLIQQLPQKVQGNAAGVVFEIGHPVADAGDDESAGPIMQLVLKYQPQNYMALYHAGMSNYVLGDFQMSQQHLKEFLRIYQNKDGWRQNALTVLRRIEKNSLPDTH
ncbi:MAG: protein kinase [Xenococcaceae cyanobacterium]